MYTENAEPRNNHTLHCGLRSYITKGSNNLKWVTENEENNRQSRDVTARETSRSCRSFNVCSLGKASDGCGTRGRVTGHVGETETGDGKETET